MSKTNAIRILEANNINFSTKEYEVDENHLDAISVAKEIGVEIESVFKTLVTIGNKNGINVFCIPANFELDLKKAALASDNKRIEMIKVKDILEITGYIRGGCSPIGMKKLYPTYIDETAILFEQIFVSAGIRGMQIKIQPNDLKNIVNGVFASLT